MKSCTVCKSAKSLSSFYVDKQNKDGRGAMCKGCAKVKQAVYYRKNRKEIIDRTTAYQKNHPDQSRMFWQRHQGHRYGVSKMEYDVLFKCGAGQCWICHCEPDPKRRLAIDHNHTTGVVRGLLCRTCNFGIGSLKDNAALCESAASYLRRGLTDQRVA